MKKKEKFYRLFLTRNVASHWYTGFFALLVMVVRSLLDADGLDNGILISGHGENLLEREKNPVRLIGKGSRPEGLGGLPRFRRNISFLLGGFSFVDFVVISVYTRIISYIFPCVNSFYYFYPFTHAFFYDKMNLEKGGNIIWN